MGLPAGVALRPATAEDRSFLLRLYASTRIEEFAPLGWDEATLAAFMRSQFEIQDRALHQAHPDAAFDIVLIGGQPAGRLYVERRAEAIDVIDIALLPEHRAQGIGTALLRGLIDEARTTRRLVRLQALKTSPALRLYRRLGFEVVGRDEVYVALELS